MTGYEQVRSVAAALAGDHEAASRVELTLPETGVCGGAGLFDDPTPATDRRPDAAAAAAPPRPAPSSRSAPPPRSACLLRRRPDGAADLTTSRRLVAPTPTRRPRTTGSGPRPPRRAPRALCVTQITSWGILYYAFPVLRPPITADTGWSTTADHRRVLPRLIVSALAGIPIGRILDRSRAPHRHDRRLRRSEPPPS